MEINIYIIYKFIKEKSSKMKLQNDIDPTPALLVQHSLPKRIITSGTELLGKQLF